MSVENVIVVVSILTLIPTGAYLIYEGFYFIRMKKEDPTIPSSIYIAAALSIFLGVVEIAFGVGHFWFLKDQ